MIRALVFIMCMLTAAYGEAVIHAGDLTRHAGPVAQPILLESAVPEFEILAKKAFSTHGAFKIAQKKDAPYVVHLEKVDTLSCRVQIDGLDWSYIAKGKSWQKAVLKACDAAVQQITGLPGYFAGTLVFVGDRGQGKEVFTGDLFFQSVRQLTHDHSDPLMPRVSPDGSKMLYTSYYKSGFPDIFTINFTTGERRAFASYKGVNTGGAYSPDGSQVAMVLSSSGTTEVYISDVSGRNPRRMTHIKSLKATPTWSPDGQHIVFTSDHLGGPQLFELSVNGTALKRIATGLSRYCAEPTWNPKHMHLIAFTGAVNKTFQIALYDAHSKECKWITQGSEDAIEPCWMNDGRHLVFTQRNKSDRKLCIVDTISGKRTVLTPKDFGVAGMGYFHK